VVIKQGDQEIKVNLPSRGMYYSKEIPSGLVPKKSSPKKITSPSERKSLR
jgi:hypothetical protein